MIGSVWGACGMVRPRATSGSRYKVWALGFKVQGLGYKLLIILHNPNLYLGHWRPRFPDMVIARLELQL